MRRNTESEALVVAPKAACRMLACSTTRLYELLNAKEIESYRDGKSRRILVASVRAYVARQVAAESTKPSKGWTDRATQARMLKKPAGNSSSR
jgi:excisionase family DNA binding protein